MDTHTRPRRTVIGITIGLYLLMFAYAVSVTLAGSLMESLLSAYDLAYSGGGLVFTFQALGGIVSILSAIYIADRVSKPVLVGACFVVYAAALVLAGTAPAYWALLALFFGIGAATRLLDSLLNATVSDLHGRNRGRYLNLLHACFGLGALTGPLYFRFLMLRVERFTDSLLFLGLACAGLAFLYLPVGVLSHRLLRGGQRQVDGTEHLEESADGSALGHPAVWALAGGMLFYTAHQGGCTAWLPLYTREVLQASPLLADAALSLFWVGIVAGRLGASLLPRRVRPLSAVVWGGALGTLVLAVGYLTAREAVLLPALVVTGMLTGAIIPLMVAEGCGWFPRQRDRKSVV
jgi:fucose permease